MMDIIFSRSGHEVTAASVFEGLLCTGKSCQLSITARVCSGVSSEALSLPAVYSFSTVPRSCLAVRTCYAAKILRPSNILIKILEYHSFFMLSHHLELLFFCLKVIR